MQPAQTDQGARDRKPAGTGIPKLRKSCDPCSLAKRRCDGQPKCSLCVKKGIRCIYGERQKSGPKGRKGLAAAAAIQQQQTLNQGHRPGSLPPPPRRRGPFVPAQQTRTGNTPTSVSQPQSITGKHDLLGVSRVPPRRVLDSGSEASFDEQEHDTRSMAIRAPTPRGAAGPGVSAAGVDPGHGHNGRGMVGSSSGEPMPLAHYDSLRSNAGGREGVHGGEGVLNERHDLIVEAKQKDSDAFGNGRSHPNRDERFHEEHDRLRVYPSKVRRIAEEGWQPRERQESTIDREPRRSQQQENTNSRMSKTDNAPRSFNDHGNGSEGAAQYHPGDRGIEPVESPSQRHWSTGQRRPVSPSHVSRSDIQAPGATAPGANSQGGEPNQNGPRTEDDPAWLIAEASWPRRPSSDGASAGSGPGRDAGLWATQPSAYPVGTSSIGGGDGERDGAPGAGSGYRVASMPAVDSSAVTDIKGDSGGVYSPQPRAGSRAEEHPPGADHHQQSQQQQQKQEYRDSTERYIQRNRVAQDGVGGGLAAPAATSASTSPSVPAGEGGDPWEYGRGGAGGGVGSSIPGRWNEREYWPPERGVYQRCDPRFEVERRGEDGRNHPYYEFPPVTKRHLFPWPIEKIKTMEVMGASRADDEAAWSRIAARVESSVSDAKDQWEAYCETMRRERWATSIAREIMSPRERMWSEHGVPTTGGPPHWATGQHPPWPYRADTASAVATAAGYPLSVNSGLKGDAYGTAPTGFGGGPAHPPATFGRCTLCGELWQTNSPSDAAALQTGRWFCPACQAGTQPGPVPRHWQDDEGHIAVPRGDMGHPPHPHTPLPGHLRRSQYLSPEASVGSNHAPARMLSPWHQRSPVSPPNSLVTRTISSIKQNEAAARSGGRVANSSVSSSPSGRNGNDIAEAAGGGRTSKEGDVHRSSPDQSVAPVASAEGVDVSRDNGGRGKVSSGDGDGDRDGDGDGDGNGNGNGNGKVSASGDFAGGGSAANISDPPTSTGMEDGNVNKATKVSVSSSLSTAVPALSPKYVSVEKPSAKSVDEVMCTAIDSTATTVTATPTPTTVASSKQLSPSPARSRAAIDGKCGRTNADSSGSVPSPVSAAAEVLRSFPLEKETSGKKFEDVEDGVTARDRNGIEVSSSIGRKCGPPADRGGGGISERTYYTQEAVVAMMNSYLRDNMLGTGRTTTHEEPWSKEDDERLMQQTERIRRRNDNSREKLNLENWKDIARNCNGRLAEDCMKRWISLTGRALWSARDDTKEERYVERDNGEHLAGKDNDAATIGGARVEASKWSSMAQPSRGSGKMGGEQEQRRSYAAADFEDDRRSREGPDRKGRLEAKPSRLGDEDTASTTKTVAVSAATATLRKDEGGYEGDDRKQRDRHRWSSSPERPPIEFGMSRQRMRRASSYYWNGDGRGIDDTAFERPRPPNGSGREDDSQHHQRGPRSLDRYAAPSRRSDYGQEHYEGGGSNPPWPRQPLGYESGRGWGPGSVWGGPVQRHQSERFRADEQLEHQHRVEWPVHGVESKPEAQGRRWEPDGPTVAPGDRNRMPPGVDGPRGPRRDEEPYHWSYGAVGAAAGVGGNSSGEGGRRYTEEEACKRISQMQDEEERRLDAIERKRGALERESGYERRPTGGDAPDEGDGRGIEGSRRMVSSSVETMAAAVAAVTARKASRDAARESGDGEDSTAPASGPRGRVGGTSYRRESPKGQLMSRVMMEGERKGDISARRSQPQPRPLDGQREMDDNVGRGRGVGRRNGSGGGGDTKDHSREMENMVCGGPESPFVGQRSELPRGSPIAVGMRSFANKKPIDRLRTEGWTLLTSAGSSSPGSSKMEPVERMRGVRIGGSSAGRDDAGGGDRKDDADAASDIGDGGRVGQKEGCSSANSKPAASAAAASTATPSPSNNREVKAKC